ncbi:MAG: sigma 54-interacting transcriptional regulator [Myxococcota bacterium]|jgi:DNA-binding NtrC family response regulator
MTDRQSTWVTRMGGDRPRRALAVYTLTVAKGADRGKQVRVDRPRFSVGALDGNGLKLVDPTVSGLHLELSHDDAGIRVRDLGSRNGTFVDGVRVVEAILTGAATLTLGATELRFEPQAGAVELPASGVDRFGPLVGSSLPMRELYAQLEAFAKTDSTVLIHGETGTGKELVAEALVQASSRAERPLVVVDCSALAPTLVESELFGHEKGAFTGATQAKPGVFERASGGTVFLDEVGELPLELQPRLLRVLERREVQRLGAKAPTPVDVRILAATHRALEAEVNAGRFRADLFYRLSVLRVETPPLRERREDVPALVRHFAGPGFTVDEKTMRRLVAHDWPGNVRELRNAVERLRAGAQPLVAAPAATAPSPGAVVRLDEPFLVQKERLVQAFERDYAKALLEACGGNLAEGARMAGVSRMAVVKMLGRLGLLPG